MMGLLIDITIGSFLTAAAIMIVRILFGLFLTPKAKYSLWLILMFRLCMFGLPESIFSVQNFQPVSQTQPVYDSVVEEVGHLLGPDYSVDIYQGVVHVPGLEVESNPTPLLIWFCGMLVCISVYAVMTLLSYNNLKKSTIVDDPDILNTLIRVRGKLGITREISVRYGPQFMIGGIFHPVMIIPIDTDVDKLEVSLIHELMHYRCGDLYLAFFRRMLCCVHWFNPVVWACFYWAKLDCEKACDYRVLELERISPSDYAAAVYHEGKMNRKTYPGTTAFGGSNLKSRIKLISKYKTPARWMLFLAGVLTGIICLTTLTGAVREDANATYASEAVYRFHLHSLDLSFSEPGAQAVLKYTLQPVDAQIIWSTDDPSVATVDEYGVVTAVGPGSCELTGIAGYTTVKTTIICDFFESQDAPEATSSEPYQTLLQEIKNILYSDYNISGDLYQVDHHSLPEFLTVTPTTVSLQLSTGDVVWRIPKNNCASLANEIGAVSSIVTDSVSEYGYFYLKNDGSYQELSADLKVGVQDIEGNVLCYLEEISKNPDGSIWATVYFEAADRTEEGIYVFELSKNDLSVLEIIKK